jgi:hypothetical protein
MVESQFAMGEVILVLGDMTCHLKPDSRSGYNVNRLRFCYCRDAIFASQKAYEVPT